MDNIADVGKQHKTEYEVANGSFLSHAKTRWEWAIINFNLDRLFSDLGLLFRRILNRATSDSVLGNVHWLTPNFMHMLC